jgi:hypothetical protein
MKDSIMVHLPEEEFDFFNLFRMKGTLYAQLREDIYKYNVTILKWYDLIGFVIHKKIIKIFIL